MLTYAKSSNGIVSSARRGEVAGGGTGDVEPAFRHRCRTGTGPVSPHQGRFRVTVRRTRQRVTRSER